MLIYNVTVKVDNDIHQEWLRWMKEIHIPDVMKTGLFIENKICKVLVDDTDGTTYSVQYTCKNLSDFEKYEKEFAAQLRKEHHEKYKDKFVAFRTLLETM